MEKFVKDSYTEQVHLVNQSDLNGYNRLFGGTLLSWIDMTAGICARRHCGKNVTTVAIDNLHFILPAYSNDLVVLTGQITYTGRTSMEVKVNSYVEGKDKVRSLINEAYVVMVALDENDKPCEVPKIVLQTEEEKAEYIKAEQRKLNRRK